MKCFLDRAKEINASIKDLSIHYQRIYDYSAEGSFTRISQNRQSLRKCDESLAATEFNKAITRGNLSDGTKIKLSDETQDDLATEKPGINDRR